MSQVALRRQRGVVAYQQGPAAERLAEQALERDGWSILARRLRNAGGEIDLVADRAGLTGMIEVKFRATLEGGAHALQPKQQARLLAAGEIALADHPEWGTAGVRFDLLVIDHFGAVRRIPDAIRA